MSNRISAPTLLLAAVIGVLGCDQPRSPQFLTINGAQEAFNYSTVRGQFQDSLPIPVTIPVFHGDLIGVSDFAFHVPARGKKSINVKDSVHVMYLNNKAVNVFNSDLEIDKSHLQDFDFGRQIWLVIDTMPTDITFDFLKSIKTGEHPLGISFNGIQNDSTGNMNRWTVENVLCYADPEILIANLDSSTVEYLAAEKKLKSIFIGDNESEDELVIPHIPSLKSIISFEETISDGSLSNNPQIENLTVNSSTTVGGLKNLRSLCVGFSDPIDLSQFATLKKLDRLILDGDTSIFNTGALQELKNLRWLRLPSGTNQDQFDSIIHFLPKLEMLEIYAGKNISDVSDLKECRSLRGLMFYGDSMFSKQGLMDLSNLKYLSLPPKAFKDEAYIRMMKKKFPNTTLVPNSGICLGSGWILLLIPFTIMLALFFRLKFQSS